MFSPSSRLAVVVVLVSGVVAADAIRGDEPKKADPPAPPPRKPWTTSKVTGSPEPPPPFKAVRVFPNVKIHHPLLIARCPGSDRARSRLRRGPGPVRRGPDGARPQKLAIE